MYNDGMTQAVQQLDPESLVARIIDELQANPDAQRLLLRVLLTNEFLGMPAHLDRIEADIAELNRRVTHIESDVAELKTDVAELKTDVAELKTDVGELKTDVAELKTDVAELKTDVSGLKTDVASLKGDNLEFKLPQRIRPFLSQMLALRRARIMQSALGVDRSPDLIESVATAAETGVITLDQETRIDATDAILRARRRNDGSIVWVAVEASNTVDGYDIDRARQAADALRAVFDEDAIAVVMGYAILAEHQQHAESQDVEVFILEPNR